MRHREHSRVDDVLLRPREQAYGVRYIPETSEMRANGCVGKSRGGFRIRGLASRDSILAISVSE